METIAPVVIFINEFDVVLLSFRKLKNVNIICLFFIDEFFKTFPAKQFFMTLS